jgi:hypothetical protein
MLSSSCENGYLFMLIWWEKGEERIMFGTRVDIRGQSLRCELR